MYIHTYVYVHINKFICVILALRLYTSREKKIIYHPNHMSKENTRVCQKKPMTLQKRPIGMPKEAHDTTKEAH